MTAGRGEQVMDGGAPRTIEPYCPVVPPSTNQPLATAAVSALGASLFVLLRLSMATHWKLAGFVLAGRQCVDPALARKGRPVQAGTGYDGQFFCRLALGLANMHRTACGGSC